MSKQYFNKLNTKKYNDLRKIELESVDVLTAGANGIESLLQKLENHFREAEPVAEEFEKAFNKAQSLYAEIVSLRLDELEDIIVRLMKEFDDLSEEFDQDITILQQDVDAFADNAEKLGINPEDIRAYKDARDFANEYSVETIGDNYGVLINESFMIKSPEFKKLREIKK
jgi:archaellum component FlaC